MSENKKIWFNKKRLVILICAFLLIILTYFIINKLNNKIISSRKIGYGLAYDTGFLGTTKEEKTKYLLFSDYNQYIETINTIDLWVEDMAITQKMGIEKTNKNFERYKDRFLNDIANSEAYQYLKEEAEKIKNEFNQGKYNEEYFKKYDLLLVETSVFNQVLHEIKLKDVCIKDNTLNVNISLKAGGVVGGGHGTLFFITLAKKDISKIQTINVKVNSTNTSIPGVAYKPIIYLYPTEDTEVNIKLGYSQNLTTSYPKYENDWKVIASRNGTMIDMNTKRKLYCLYYECHNKIDFKIEKDGFIVKDEDVAIFLEEKLSILGLNERETEEFIIYWLPILESNRYNYIRFATIDEINKNMPLIVNPNPETIIRILMTYKGLNNPIEVKEQKLITPERTRLCSCWMGWNWNKVKLLFSWHIFQK